MRDEGFLSPRIDYTDAASIESGLDAVLSQTDGRLDALFHNGAYAIPGAAEDIPSAALRAIFEANVFGWHTLTRRVLPVMRARNTGRIVYHSSVLGLVSQPWRAAYNATKYATEAMADTLRLELADTGIRIITLNTGPVTSRIRQNAVPHFERWVDWRGSALRAGYEARLLDRLYTSRGPDFFERPPEAVTRALVHALEARRPRPRYLITTPSHVALALRRLLPTRMLDRILARGQ